MSLNPALYSSVIIVEPVCLFFLFPWFPSAPVPLFEVSQSSRETSLVGESVRFPQTTDLTEFSFHVKFEKTYNYWIVPEGLGLPPWNCFPWYLQLQRSYPCAPFCANNIIKRLVKLELDMRSEGPCQLTGRVDGVSERPVEGGEATQSTFELTSAPGEKYF